MEIEALSRTLTLTSFKKLLGHFEDILFSKLISFPSDILTLKAFYLRSKYFISGLIRPNLNTIMISQEARGLL